MRHLRPPRLGSHAADILRKIEVTEPVEVCSANHGKARYSGVDTNWISKKPSDGIGNLQLPVTCIQHVPEVPGITKMLRKKQMEIDKLLLMEETYI